MSTSCHSCGATMIESARFCRRCGTPFDRDFGWQSAAVPPVVPTVSPSDTCVRRRDFARRLIPRWLRDHPFNRATSTSTYWLANRRTRGRLIPFHIFTGRTRKRLRQSTRGASAALSSDLYKTVVSPDDSLARTTPAFKTGEFEGHSEAKPPNTFARNAREAHGDDDDEELTIVRPMPSPPAATVMPVMTATVADSSPSSGVAYQAAGLAPEMCRWRVLAAPMRV